MIIKCEECRSRFNLDDSMVREEGTKVKCSVCKNIFTVFPEEPEPVDDLLEDDMDDDMIDEAMEETVSLDLPSDIEEIGPEALSSETSEEEIDDFDEAFETALEEDIQEIPLDEMTEPDKIDTDTEGMEDDGAELPFERPDARTVTSRMIRRQRQSKVLLFALVIVLAFIIAGLAVFFLAPDLLPDSFSSLKPVDKDAITDTGVRKLSFKGVNGDFVTSNKLGQLFVIRGEVINDNPKSRSYILLKGTILDDTGKAIRRKLIYAGNTFTDDQLRDMTLEEIDAGLKTKSGKDDSDVDIKPGTSVPFMIIFEKLPENLGEFIVEAVSSSPGK